MGREGGQKRVETEGGQIVKGRQSGGDEKEKRGKERRHKDIKEERTCRHKGTNQKTRQ